MARAENPIEKYGMSRYDVANKKPRGQEGTFQNRDGNQARDEAQSAARETVSPTFSELQSQGRARPARPALPTPMMNVSQMFGGGQPAVEEDGGDPVMPNQPGGDEDYGPPPTLPNSGQPPATGSPYQQAVSGVSPMRTPAKGPKDPLAALLQGQLGNPRGNNTDGWQVIMNNLKAQFGDQRENLNEDLARRGLWSSSGDIGASGALGRLDADNNRTMASARLDYDNQRESQRNEILRILAPLIYGR